MALPPLPAGASLVPASDTRSSERSRPDPLKRLMDEGFEWTNGFRADGDVQRIRDQGYKPATNGAHNRGDGLDLTHPTLSPAEQASRLEMLFGDWDGRRIIDEGHHRHLELPGWGSAPGTPATPNAGIPPLPEGATLYQRGALDATPSMASVVESRDRAHSQTGNSLAPRRSEAVTMAPAIAAAHNILFKDQQPEKLFAQLSPEQEAEIAEYARRSDVTPEMLIAFGLERGAQITNAQQIIDQRNKGGGVLDTLLFQPPEAPPNKDGGFGAAARGVADPFNVLDELGAVVDSVGLTNGRENIWNSDRSFRDVLYGNIDANRSILRADERDHWKERFGGQLASGLLLPFGNKAHTAGQLAKWGAIEGGAAGFGAGEGNALERLPNAGVGTTLGAGGGFVLGKTIDVAAPYARAGYDRFRGRGAVMPDEIFPNVGREAAYNSAPIVEDSAQSAGPTPAARTQPQGGIVGEGPVRPSVRLRQRVEELQTARTDRAAAMESGLQGPSLSAGRFVDRIDVADLPPLPPGASLLDDAALGRVRPIGDQPTASEIAEISNSFDPADITPMPRNAVQREPEATAYEDLLPTGGKAGNINLTNFDSVHDIDRAMRTIERRFGGFDAATRGKITHAETKALASEMGMSVSDLLRARSGRAFNAEEATRARQLLAKAHDEMQQLARRAIGGTDEDKLTFRKSVAVVAAIQERVAGATAEAGRSLSAFRIPASSRAINGRVLRELVEASGGSDDIEDLAGRILELQDPGKAAAYARQIAKPKFKDKAVELWYNWLLSGPQTHVVNFISNTATSLAQLPEHAVAAGLGAARRAAGVGDADRVMLSEVGARAIGWLNGAREGLRLAGRTFRTGQQIDPMSKVEQLAQEAISGKKGYIIRTPSRALAASDEMFKAMARRMELGGLAIRKAKIEGLKGPAAAERAAELTANPTDEMIEAAFDYGRYMTFQRPVGPWAKPISDLTRNAPILKLVIPFIRTPTNLLKFAVERSPAAPMLREWRDDVAAGGAKRDLALTRAMVGSAVGAMIMEMTGRGLITGGGPLDENAKNIMRADGWQPYSVKIGDRYVSFQRLDPFATTFGMAADLASKSEYMTDKQREDFVSLMVASIMQQMQSKTWLSGLSDLTQALDDPDRFGPSFLSRIGGSIAVPALVAQTARTLDPVMRDTRGDGFGASVTNRIKSRIPGLSETLPARRDVWGREIVSEGGLGPDAISPFWTSTARNDPINREALLIDARIGRPGRQISNGDGMGGRRDLTAEEYSTYQELAGRYMRDDFAAATADPGWATLSPQDRQIEFKRIADAARADARSDLFGDGSLGNIGAGAAELPPLPPGAELLPR